MSFRPEPMINGLLLQAAKAAIALGGVDGLERFLRRRAPAGRIKRALRYTAYEQYLAEHESQAFDSLEDLISTAKSLAECRRDGDWSTCVLSGKKPFRGRTWV